MFTRDPRTGKPDRLIEAFSRTSEPPMGLASGGLRTPVSSQNSA
jgi:hypothetical protein